MNWCFVQSGSTFARPKLAETWWACHNLQSRQSLFWCRALGPLFACTSLFLRVTHTRQIQVDYLGHMGSMLLEQFWNLPDLDLLSDHKSPIILSQPGKGFPKDWHSVFTIVKLLEYFTAQETLLYMAKARRWLTQSFANHLWNWGRYFRRST